MERKLGDENCITCGACCASYRVSFYWAEAAMPGGVPEAFTEKINHHRIAMRGTNQKSPYCIALQGNIGEYVNCTIYGIRPSPCREFDAGSDRCYEARTRHGVKEDVSGICA